MGLGFLSSLFGGGKKEAAPAPMELPQPPAPDAAATTAADKIKKKKNDMSQSIYTSPLGVQDQANVIKTKLGQ